MHSIISIFPFFSWTIRVNHSLIACHITPKNLMGNNQVNFRKKILPICEFKVL